MSTVKTSFVISGNNVTEVVEYNDYFIPYYNEFFLKSETISFDTREEAMFQKALSSIIEGKPVEKYKSSKYYDYYLTRLKQDYPEYCI